MAKKKEVLKEQKPVLELQTLPEKPVDVSTLTEYAFVGDTAKLDEDLAFGTAWVTPFKIRTSRPVTSDAYAKAYINYQTGGWSGAIVCSDDPINVLPNCVGYANGRFNEIYGELTGYSGSKYPWFNCNACNFIQRRNEMYPELVVGSEPKPGAIIVWTGGWGDYGHVAIVERINYDGSIFTSESAYGGSFFYTATRYPANEWGMGGTYKFAGFIYNPAVKDIYPDVTPDDKKDAKKNQLICHISDLRVRTTPSLASDDNILDLLPQDLYYDYYEIKTADNYEWYKIADGQWCARVDENAPEILPHDLFPPKYTVNVTGYKEGKIDTDKNSAMAFETVNVNAVPVKGYAVKKLMVNGKEFKDSFKMPRIGNVTITAEWEESGYEITCNQSFGGEISTSTDWANKGETVHVNVTPDDGYKLKSLYSEQVVVDKNSFTFVMPGQAVVLFAEFEEVVEPEFKVGDKVTIKRVGNSKPDGTGHTVFNIGEKYLITNIIWNTDLSLAKFPYQLSAWNGTVLGYYDEDAIVFYEEVPIDEQEFEVGDYVKIVGRGNSKSNGSGVTTFGVGFKKYVLDYIPNSAYPYKVGKGIFTQGYYKSKDLKKI